MLYMMQWKAIQYILDMHPKPFQWSYNTAITGTYFLKSALLCNILFRNSTKA